jgi:PAS domain S-box-containing protein
LLGEARDDHGRVIMELPAGASPDVRQLADFKRALDQAAIVATTDVTGRITYANEKFCEISGYTREELLGQDHRIINSGYHCKEFMRDLWTTIAQGHVWHGEIRNQAKDGHHYWVDTTIVPFLNERGEPYQYTAIRVDVTGRKMAEERLAEHAVYARLASMAGVVAHEVRNSLAGVKGAMQVLLSRRAANRAELAVIRDVITRVDSSCELINDLMMFAWPRPPQLGVVPLRALVHDTIATVRRNLNEGSIEITLKGDEVNVTADAELVRATMNNLLANAVQAIEGSGRVRVTVGRKDAMAFVEVLDTGPGIPLELRSRVFEPFFTTKTSGGGLGLPIARRTAAVHGGSLVVDCPRDGGTRVILTLPVQLAPFADP